MTRRKEIRDAADAVLDLSPAVAEKAARGFGYRVTSDREGHPDEIIGRINLARNRSVTGSMAMWKMDNPIGGHMEIGNDIPTMLSSLMINRSLDSQDLATALKEATLSPDDGSLDAFVERRMIEKGINIDDPEKGWGDIFGQAFTGATVWTEEEADVVMDDAIRSHEEAPRP